MPDPSRHVAVGGIPTRAPWLVIGAGPCGLATLDELLASGVAADDIVLIGPSTPSGPTEAGQGEATVASSFASALRDGALTKAVNGTSVSIEDVAAQGTLSQHWGASCLPMPVSAEGATSQAWLDAYGRTTASWQVNAERDPLTTTYPLTAETTGGLPRKRQAHAVVESARGQVVGHSRLAVRAGPSNRGCIGRSLCFHGCPVHAPWRADEALAATHEDNPGLTLLPWLVDGLSAGEGGDTMVHAGGESIRAERVLVAAGWRATVQLLGGSPPRLDATADVEQSTVVMAPVLLRSRATDDDFFRSFTYHDLVVPHHVEGGELAALTQLYLPTHELAGRMLASVPRSMSRSVQAMLSRPSSGRALTRPLRHVGVAMTFLPGSRQWGCTQRGLDTWRRHVPGSLREILRVLGGRVVDVNKVVLAAGQSQHVGAWTRYADVVPQLLSGDRLRIPGGCAGQRALAVDPCLLPTLHPGPHTAIAAACARLAVQEVIRQW